MLTAHDAHGTKLIAWATEKHQGPFRCPGCASEVVLKKGAIKVHHFAHRPPVTCRMGMGETALHLQAKKEIFEALQGFPGVEDLELERDFGISRADVYARIRGTPVAIELQRSDLTVQALAQRTANYHRLGIAVLWVGVRSEAPSPMRYAPRAWERWCHAAYFGRVYYWVKGQILSVMHFAPYHIDVEAKSWHDSDGTEHSGGGYLRVSKRWRRLKFGQPVHIAMHFQRQQRGAWRGGDIIVPDCTLYVDQQAKWWG